MTSAEWDACADPGRMLRTALGARLIGRLSALLRTRRDRAVQRKVRLYLCSCCRLIWDTVGPRSRAAVEVAERYADGMATRAELRAAWRGAESEALWETGAESWWTRRLNRLVPPTPWGDIDFDCDLTLHAADARVDVGYAAELTCWRKERGQCDLLRDLFTPFGPAPIDPVWLTPAVVSLAQATYAERSFPSGQLDPARLAVLADALEKADRTDAAILSHLRGPGPHVRGCHVLDLLLGRE
jgi:hypothetical protein